METKWHINGQGQVGRCSAKKKCPFGGVSGFENHYTNKEDAELAAISKLEGVSPWSTAKKNGGVSFQQTRDSMKKTLLSLGVAKANELPEVSNTKELVEKWFDGDKSKFEDFKELSSNKELAPAAKKAMAQMLNKGLSIQKVDSFNKLDEGATVDILDESVTLDLKELRNRRPF